MKLQLDKLGSLFKFKTSLKLPILFADKFSSLSDINPSRPIPITSILFCAMFSSIKRLRFCKPSICSILLSSSHSFSSWTHFSRPLILLILFEPKKRCLSMGNRSKSLMCSIWLLFSQIRSTSLHLSMDSISAMPCVTQMSSLRFGK